MVNKAIRLNILWNVLTIHQRNAFCASGVNGKICFFTSETSHLIFVPGRCATSLRSQGSSRLNKDQTLINRTNPLNNKLTWVYHSHYDVTKWKHFPRYWPFVREFTGPGEFPAQRPVTRTLNVFFDLRLNERLSKQPRSWWFEMPSWS